jgi:hypothetical protein
MSVVEPPPQVSPDGKFYWDGKHWAPMQGQPSQPQPMAQPQLSQLPPGYEIKKKGHGARNGTIGCLGLIALVIVIGIASSGHGTSGNSSTPSTPGTRNLASPAPLAPAPVAAPAAHQVLLDKYGDGINKTAIFQTTGEWTITYDFDCTSFGSAGNFQVYVYDGNSALKDIPVNSLSMKGTDTVFEHNLSGPYYLEMNSECAWHVIVKG